MNIVNVVTLPERTPLAWTDLSLSRDIESYAWTLSLSIANEGSLAAIKPNGTSMKEIEVNVNGEVWNFFISKTATRITNKARTYNVTGLSSVRLLDYPYSAKRTFTDDSGSSASQIVTRIAQDAGFTIDWQAPDWVVPAKVFSYQNESPIGAILRVTNAIGAIIEPSMSEKKITVKPYYPTSPWQWSLIDEADLDRTMFESQMFSIDTNWLPMESPDSVYVHGDVGGVFCKIKKAGTAGLVSLPTVVENLITDNIAAQERGRIEIAKNGFREVIPMSTYVDENGVVMPSEIVEFTELNGVAKWRGMVASTNLSITRNGTALVQTIGVIRHYD